jgi:outer membrane protease
VAIADGSIKDGPRARYESDSFSASFSIGLMTGKANEFVYSPTGATVSHLIWTFDNNPVFTGAFAWRPSPWLTLGLNARTLIGKGESTMDDFDFPGAVCGVAGPFCHSHHPNTKVKDADSIDIYAAGTFYRAHGFAFSGVAGYKWDHYSWGATGGTSNYAPPFPSVPVISYAQWWEAPYVGLQTAGHWGPWSFETRVIGSWWVSAHDRDNHHLTTTLFRDEFGNDSSMIAVNAKIGYALSKNVSVTLSYDYQEWFLAKGPTTATNYTTGATAVFPGNAAGADNYNHTVSAGLKVKF